MIYYACSWTKKSKLVLASILIISGINSFIIIIMQVLHCKDENIHYTYHLAEYLTSSAFTIIWLLTLDVLINYKFKYCLFGLCCGLARLGALFGVFCASNEQFFSIPSCMISGLLFFVLGFWLICFKDQ